MSRHAPTGPVPWIRSRYGFALFHLISLVAGWLCLRIVLLVAFRPAANSESALGLALFSGLQRDLFVGLILTLPLLCWFAVLPERLFHRRAYRLVFLGVLFAFWSVQIFLFFVEFFFFEEFRSRFNTVAVDYLLYPQEVFLNIWESYPVAWFLLICLLLAAGWLFVASRVFARMWERAFSTRTRLAHFAGALAFAALLALTINFKGAHPTHDRTLNEIANNGVLSFSAAAWTHNLEYAAFYKTLPPEEAYARIRHLLLQPGAEFVEQGQSMRRKIEGDSSRPRLNVVLFLEESLGSEFWGCLGREQPTLTPEMDKLATEEGILFTNLYASGNRTVRGFEGVLSSFPPLPGDSIVKRDRSENVETIARVLKREGYATVFLYGGRGLFDGMRKFATQNGYDRFIEQNDFKNPTFTTVWGVCDEDIFERTIEELRVMAKAEQPFFATILSVSNHKPYTYPTGRIPENPAKQKRPHAVKYSDYALGKFFSAAKKESFWTNTIFAVVADHGARVYGKQSIPIHSYEIPLVVLGPAVVSTPTRVGQLGGSLDVAPTILGLLGRPYETLFFGRDLLKGRPDEGRALLNHNRDIGLLARERLVVLGLRQTAEFYEGNPKLAEMTELLQPSEADRELERDAIAIYQVADELYMNRRYRLNSGSQAGKVTQLTQ